MPVKHPFVSNVVDVGGPTYVQPTHWNSAHNAPPVTLFDFSPNAAASFGIPSTAGPTGMEWPQSDTAAAGRESIDFSYVDRLLFCAGRASNANTGAVNAGSVALRFQYMASGFPGSWYSFDATGGSAPFISMATGANASLYLASANGQMVASAVVSAAAKALAQPMTCRVAGYGGNGSAVFISQMNVYGY